MSQSKEFKLPSKNQLRQGNSDISVILLDATEIEIQRPKKQKKYYSGKKKRHTMKVQLTVNVATLDICSLNISLFQKSRLDINDNIQIIADKGYQGLKTGHKNSHLPFKKTKYNRLTEIQRAYNYAISKNRIKIEHVNGYLKRFHILLGKYRNKRSSLSKVVKLLCAIYNFQHKVR